MSNKINLPSVELARQQDNLDALPVELVPILLERETFVEEARWCVSGSSSALEHYAATPEAIAPNG